MSADLNKYLEAISRKSPSSVRAMLDSGALDQHGSVWIDAARNRAAGAPAREFPAASMHPGPRTYVNNHYLYRPYHPGYATPYHWGGHVVLAHPQAMYAPARPPRRRPAGARAKPKPKPKRRTKGKKKPGGRRTHK